MTHVRMFPAVVCMAAVLAVSAVASAQDRYRLDGDQWQAQVAADPASPEGQLQGIRRLIAAEDYHTAQDQATLWIESYPNHPELVEAYFLRADARVGRGRHYKALFDYEHVIRTYPASEQFLTALEREFEIARLFVAGVKRHLWGMRIMSAHADGEEIFIRIQERVPGSELGEKASLALADYYFAESRMAEAATAYDLFLLNYPQSDHREGVLLRLIQASLATFKGPQFDSRGLLEASQRIRQYQQEYPVAAERIGADALLVRIDESLALKAYLTAGWFEGRGRRVSAVMLYQRVVRDHPQTAPAAQAVQRLQAMGELTVATPAPAPAPEEGVPVPEAQPGVAPAPADPSAPEASQGGGR